MSGLNLGDKDIEQRISDLETSFTSLGGFKGELNASTGTLPLTANVGDWYVVTGIGDSLGDIQGDDDLSNNDAIVYTNIEGDNDSTNPRNWFPFQRNDDDSATQAFVIDVLTRLSLLESSPTSDDIHSGVNHIGSTESITIESNKEMVVSNITIDGILTVDGILTILT